MSNTYQLKFTLRDSKPPIWRRVLVKNSTNLFELHQIIQVMMGWTDSHRLISERFTICCRCETSDLFMG